MLTTAEAMKAMTAPVTDEELKTAEEEVLRELAASIVQKEGICFHPRCRCERHYNRKLRIVTLAIASVAAIEAVALTCLVYVAVVGR